MWIGMIESVLQKLIKRAVNSYLVSKGKSFNSATRQIINVIQMNCSRKTGCSQFLIYHLNQVKILHFRQLFPLQKAQKKRRRRNMRKSFACKKYMMVYRAS
jgi:hypothetical protein